MLDDLKCQHYTCCFRTAHAPVSKVCDLLLSEPHPPPPPSPTASHAFHEKKCMDNSLCTWYMGSRPCTDTDRVLLFYRNAERAAYSGGLPPLLWICNHTTCVCIVFGIFIVITMLLLVGYLVCKGRLVKCFL